MRVPSFLLIMVAIAALIMIFMLFGPPKPAQSDNRPAVVERTQRAFCNCIQAKGAMDLCLASAETGRGIGVTDQELLLSPCLDRH